VLLTGHTWTNGKAPPITAPTALTIERSVPTAHPASQSCPVPFTAGTRCAVPQVIALARAGLAAVIRYPAWRTSQRNGQTAGTGRRCCGDVLRRRRRVETNRRLVRPPGTASSGPNVPTYALSCPATGRPHLARPVILPRAPHVPAPSGTHGEPRTLTVRISLTVH
jgi:hypothetical protein